MIASTHTHYPCTCATTTAVSVGDVPTGESVGPYCQHCGGLVGVVTIPASEPEQQKPTIETRGARYKADGRVATRNAASARLAAKAEGRR